MGSLLSQIERVPVDSLVRYPGNPRRGNVAVIAESLRENEQYAPLVVQLSTRYVLAGNHTLDAAQQIGWPEIDVVFVDVDDQRARKIVLSSNRTAELGTYDDAALAELLTILDGDYDGVGYNADDLDDLLDRLGQMPVLPPGATDADYVESPDEIAARTEKFADAQPKAAFGIREMVLVYPQDDYTEIQGLAVTVRRACGNETTIPEAVLAGMRVAARLAENCKGSDGCAWCS